MHDGAQSCLTPTSYLHLLYAVISVCHGLELYLGISLIRENLLIAVGHTSWGKSTCQIDLYWCNQLHEKGHYQDYQL